MIKIKSFEERETAAVEAAASESPSLLSLLPFSAISITEEAHQKNAEVGRILDGMSGKHFEWYGYSLAEKRSLAVIVDTLIQPNQTVSGVDVDFAPIEAKKAFDELQVRNAAEGRLGSGSELVPVGIVHRHGFSARKPFRSQSDVRNLSYYVQLQAAQTEFLSTQTDRFEQVGQFAVQVSGSTLRLVPKSGDNLILSYDFAGAGDLLLYKLGLDAERVRANGGLARLVGDILGSGAKISAEQNRFVSYATSLIYNRDGNSPFGEIIVLATGSVEGKYEKAFEVPVSVLPGTGGCEWSLSGLEREVDAKISWARKKVQIRLPGKAREIIASRREASELIGSAGIDLWERFWPVESAIELVRRGDAPGMKETAVSFFLAAAGYVNNCKAPKVDYACYLFSVMAAMQQGQVPLTQAVKNVGRLFKDPVYQGGRFQRPPVESLKAGSIVANICSPRRETQGLEYSFMRELTSAGTDGVSRVLEKYVPMLLAAGKAK
ncbi:hypothetical protein HYU17_02140 [Candidatus Woesearchaeota archaeon]|nr:hypothetical protein [Candidatus Woesearchaeota archaeon]